MSLNKKLMKNIKELYSINMTEDSAKKLWRLKKLTLYKIGKDLFMSDNSYKKFKDSLEV